MGAEEVNAFLTHLVVSENVAASTQAQALSALLSCTSMSSAILCPDSRCGARPKAAKTAGSDDARRGSRNSQSARKAAEARGRSSLRCRSSPARGTWSA
ncbi:MAG TPA: phage integrase N-terminal SAM-like domain-containing protein [Thermoanaerobaculia bacterium]